jgi:hypothetical protein
MSDRNIMTILYYRFASLSAAFPHRNEETAHNVRNAFVT